MSHIDVASAFGHAPEPQDFVLPGLLAGTVGALVSPGGTGKSFLALQIAAAVAGGASANITGLKIDQHGRALYINLEDPEEELRRRLHALGTRLDPLARQAVAASLTVRARLGMDSNVLHGRFHDELVKACCSQRLVVLDTLSRTHSADENDNGAMSALIGRLESIVRKTGAALLFLHHTSKAAVLGGHAGYQQAARGASALIDNARFAAGLVHMTADEAEELVDPEVGRVPPACRNLYVKYLVSKHNYGAPQPAQWYRRSEWGVLEPITLEFRGKPRKKRESFVNVL